MFDLLNLHYFKMSIFHDEVEIEDMEYDEDTQTYHYPCPCGDKFEITLVSVQFRRTQPPLNDQIIWYSAKHFNRCLIFLKLGMK